MVLAGLIDGFVGFVTSPFRAAAGWAWEEVVGGIANWVAKGLLLAIEWVWGVIDSSTSPDLAAPWFADGGIATRVGLLGLVVAVMMMLVSAIQAALLGRPEQIIDAVRTAVFALAGAAVTVTAADVAIKLVDGAAGWLWANQRDGLRTYLESLMAVFSSNTVLAGAILGPLLMVACLFAMIGLAVALFTRGALLYLVAAFAPLVFSLGILPSFRGAVRKIIHLGVALILSKLAIVIALCVAVQLGSTAAPDSAAEAIRSDLGAIGLLVTGFFCFLVASISPVVVYKLMPTAEDAVASSGVVGGWARGATSAAYTADFAHRKAQGSPGDRAVPGQDGGVTAQATSGGGSGGGAGAGAGGGAVTGAGAAAGATGVAFGVAQAAAGRVQGATDDHHGRGGTSTTEAPPADPVPDADAGGR